MIMTTRDGTCERDYVDVVQLAGAHVSAINKIDSIKKFECINIGSGSGITVLELVNSFKCHRYRDKNEI